MAANDPVEIACRVVYMTEKAVRIDDGKEIVWVPKSQIEEADDLDEDTKSITIPEWLAQEKGLI